MTRLCTARSLYLRQLELSMLYLSGIILAFFLSFILLTKKNKGSADYLLLAWLLVSGYHLLSFYMLFTGQMTEDPTLPSLGIPLPLAHGPFLYLYTRQQTSNRPFRTSALLHFAPVLLSYLLFLEFFLLGPAAKASVFASGGKGFELQLGINLYTLYASGIIYITLSFRQLLRYKKTIVQQFSNTGKINFNWLLFLILWILVIWIFVLVSSNDQLIFGAAALFILWIGYFGIKQVRVFSQPQSTQNQKATTGNPDFSTVEEPATAGAPGTVKYQKSALRVQESVQIHEKLRRHLEVEKPFTNPDLTLNDLAKSMGIPPYQLSQVINTHEQKSFYDLINEKRVQEFIRLLSAPGSRQYTLLSMAYDCGFNSKASFNRNFKKHSGHTPSHYQKLMLQQEQKVST